MRNKTFAIVDGDEKVAIELGTVIAENIYYCNTSISSIQVKLMTNHKYNNVVILVDDQYILKYVPV